MTPAHRSFTPNRTIAMDKPEDFTIDYTINLVSAFVARNALPASELPALLHAVHAAISGLGKPVAAVPAEPQKPAVAISKSVQPDYLISLEDGRKFKSLKRHLMAEYGMTPDAYRAKWGLAKDYPMVAPAYGAARSALAKSLGLGRKPSAAVN